jgi:hypothetical protein
VFDRTLLRAGETLHMKHFLRRHTAAGFAMVRAGDKPRAVARRDTEDKQAFRPRLPPPGHRREDRIRAGLGCQRRRPGRMEDPAGREAGRVRVLVGGQVSGSFRVEQFRVPTMKAVLKAPPRPRWRLRVSFDAQVGYLSGGPAGQAPVKLRSVVQDTGVQFPGYEEFSLGLGDVQGGRGGAGQRGRGRREASRRTPEGEGSQLEAARTQSLNLDRAGGARIAVDKLPPLDKPKSLLAELSYQDANGETSTVAARVRCGRPPTWSA